MDYKLIIILLILLFLIILVYKEVYSFREQINKTVSNVLFQLKDTNERALIKFQSNMNKCVGQIKGISNDNIQQLRKINTLNQQYVVRKNPNHFTEVENSETAAYRTELGNFSDMRQSRGGDEKVKNIFEKKESGSFYMSDDTKKTKDTDELSEDAEKSSRVLNQLKQKKLEEKKSSELNKNVAMVCDGDKCYIPQKNTMNKDTVIIEDVSYHDESTNIPIYKPVENDDQLPIYKPMNENVLKKSIIETENDSDDEIQEIDEENDDNTDSESEESEKPVNKKQDIEKSVIEDDDYLSDAKSLKDDSSKKKNKNMTGSAFMEIIKDTEKININDNIYIDNSDTDAENIVMDNIIGSITKNNINKDNGKELNSDDIPSLDSFDAEQSSNKIDMSGSIKELNEKKLPFDEQIKRAKMQIKEEEYHPKSHHSASRSKFSRMSKKSVISIVTDGDTRKSGITIKTKADDGPVQIKNYSLKNSELQTIDDYTIIELKEIAKRYSLPTGYRDRNRFKQYKKAELYDNIKSYFDNKSKSDDDSKKNSEENDNDSENKSEDHVVNEENNDGEVQTENDDNLTEESDN